MFDKKDFEFEVAVGFSKTGIGVPYHYMTNIPNLVAGDAVVVDTPSEGYRVAYVVSERKKQSNPYIWPKTGKATKPIVCKVYDSKYKDYVRHKTLLELQGLVQTATERLNNFLKGL